MGYDNMNGVHKTVSSNWTSHSGADLKCIDECLREKAILKYIRRGTVDLLNQGVLDAYNLIQDVSENNKVAMLEGENAVITLHNNLIYELNNINPKDGVPAYVENELLDPVSELSDMGKYVVEEQRQCHLSELYDAVMKDGLDSYLSDDVKDVLNADSYSFQTYSEAKMLEQAHEIEKNDAQKAKNAVKPNRDYSQGFEIDEAGNQLDDGYGFDE